MGSSRFQTLTQKQPERPAKTLRDQVKPLQVDWRDDSPALIVFDDGASSAGSCIRCVHPPCMEYSNHELEIEAFRDFPYDRNNAVCPTGAITWPLEEYAPAVDPDTCISCGLCVSRCPTRAIYLDEHGAHVNDEPNYHFQVRDFPATTDNTEATARLFDGIAEDGIYRAETDDVFGRFFRHFREVAKNQSAQFPNHLARNLLIACGVGAAMRRRGDTNVRMEMVLGPPGVEGGTADVELGAGVLDAPRKVLDNIAILVARYRMAKDRVVPLVITLSMPNQRSEYWQVVRDIRDVLGVKINSLTIGALVLLLWNRTKIAVREGEELYVDVDSTSLRPGVEAFLGRKINVVRGYPGLLESEK